MTTEAAGTNGKALAPPAAITGIAPGGFAMHPIVQAILAQSPTTDTLEKLWALQREWDADNARKAYTAALTAAKAEMDTVIGKDKTVDYVGERGRVYYKHASLAAVIDAATVPLAKHGLSLSWKAGSSKEGVTVVAVLTHVGGHVAMSDPLTAPPDNSGRKSGAQAVSSTVTLLSRYTAMSLLGLAAGDMTEDGDAPRDETPRDDAPREASPEVQEERKRLEEARMAMAKANTVDELKKAGVEYGAKLKTKAARDEAESFYRKRYERIAEKMRGGSVPGVDNAKKADAKSETPPQGGENDGDYGPPDQDFGDRS